MSELANEPTVAGFYAYKGGRQLMIFMLDHDGQWFAWLAGNPDVSRCHWGYIEQSLNAWDLVLLDEVPSLAEVTR